MSGPSALNSLVFIIACVTLFVFGLQSFSREIQTLAVGPLRETLHRATRNRFAAAISGVLATALIQSSSAVSALAVALTDARLLSLHAVMGVLIGANIGTASTAFLISMKLQGLGAYLIVLGALLSLLPIKMRVIGKTVFYFGFIFFALDQLSGALNSLYSHEILTEALLQTRHPLWGMAAGAILTAVLQSSSVVSGLVVVLCDQGNLPLEGAVAVILGANIGTCSTALVASLGMKRKARAAALAHFSYNLAGAVLLFPFLNQLTQLARHLGGESTGLAVAYSHLLFNLTTGALFLALLNPFHDFLLKIVERTEAKSESA